MNDYYTFIGEPISSHFNTHLEIQHQDTPIRIIQQYYCHICYPPSDTTTEPLNNFISWIQERGAISGSFITEQLFEDIFGADLISIEAEELRKRVIRLLNTLIYQNKHTIKHQLFLVRTTLESFLNLEFKEDPNISDGFYSETASNIESTEDQQIIINSEEDSEEEGQDNNLFQEQLIIQTDSEEEFDNSDQEQSSEGNLTSEPEQSDTEREATEESDNEEMANLDAVLNGLNALTAALTVGLRSEKNHIPIRKFKGDDQDPVEWLRDFEVAATANGVTDARKIQIVRGYLEGAAAAWFDQRAINNLLALTA